MKKQNLAIIFMLLSLIFTACTHNKNIETESIYIIDFKNVSILKFAEKVSTIIDKEIIFKHKVKGKTNFVTNSKGIEKAELIPLLNAILADKGMTLINKGTHYLVLGGCYNEESDILKINNIKEAMYRHLLENKSTELSYYFLAFKQEDENKKLLDRLKDISPQVLPKSMSKVYNRKEMQELTGKANNFELMTRGTLVHHKENGGKGIIYIISCINKISDTKVVVTWGDYVNMLNASESNSTLELIDGKWIVTNTTQVWVS